MNLDNTASRLYLDLIKKCLTFYIWGETLQPVIITGYRSRPKRLAVRIAARWLSQQGIHIYHQMPFDPQIREDGKDHPALAHTMIGLKRLNNLQECVETVIREEIPGDLIETGVWRGGAVIFMRAILKAYGVLNRMVWAADSFEGLPQPDPDKYPEDRGDVHHLWSHLAVSLEEVKENFAKYDLLDDQVRFLKGWFKDTLPAAPIKQLAVLRLDGDMYESTMDALVSLYPKLSIGGYLIVDDYGYIASCRQAVHDYRDAHGIDDEIRWIDSDGVYWRRS